VTMPSDSGLTGKSIGGAAWFAAQTLVVKSSTLVTQFILAYLLVPDDFGLIAVAMAVAALAGALFRHGLAQVLVERSPHTHALAKNAFWLSMAMGAAATVFMVAAAPLVALLVGEPEVRNLIWILALTIPIQAASVSPRARLLSDLEFGKVARVNGAQIVLRGALTVLLAWLELGAYSFALAELIASAIELGLYRREHPLDAHAPRDRSAWPALTRDTAYLVSAGVLAVITAQGDYFILGIFAPATDVGLYFFAYRLSIQGVAIFTNNIGRVLFPALTQLPRGSERQHRAFVRAVRALAGVGIPIGVLGAALGTDLIVFAFNDDWSGAGVILQILCVAAVVRSVSDSYVHLLTAQGRFRKLLIWASVVTLTFLAVVSIGAWADGATGTAIAVTIHASLSGWILYTLTVRPAGGTAAELPRILIGPVIASGLLTAVGLALAQLAGLDTGDWRRLVLPVMIVAAGYLPLLRIVSPPTADELLTIRRYVLVRLRRRPLDDRPPGGNEAGQEPEHLRKP
jgi:O-antigen/teichoic acid export membrane protein